MPTGCSQSDGADGQYVTKHDPFVCFGGASGNGGSGTTCDMATFRPYSGAAPGAYGHSMTIREPRPTDFDDVVETFFSFFPEVEADPSFGLLLFRKQPTVEDERKWFDDTLRDIRDGNDVMRVAEVDSHVVGWCDVRRTRPGTPRDHRGLLGICIRKGFRGRGLGTALLGEVLEACKGRFEAVELSVLSTNPRAFELYKRFGFREVGVMPGAFKRAGIYIDERMMQLKL